MPPNKSIERNSQVHVLVRRLVAKVYRVEKGFDTRGLVKLQIYPALYAVAQALNDGRYCLSTSSVKGKVSEIAVIV